MRPDATRAATGSPSEDCPAARQDSKLSKWRYALVVLGIAIVTAVRVAAEPVLDGGAPFALFYLPILLSAWRLGLGPTLVAIGLSLVSAAYFFVPFDEPGNPSELALYLVVSAAMAALARSAANMRRAGEDAVAFARRAHRAAEFATWDFDARHDVLRCEGFEQLLGVHLPSDLVEARAHMRSLIHADDRGRFEAQLAELVRSGRHFELDLRIMTPTRGLRWISASGEIERDELDHIVGVSGMCLDITDQRAADVQRALLAAVVESSDDAILTKDLDGTITSANAGAERLFGMPASELVGRPVSVLVPPERRSEPAAILARLRRGERVDHFETVRLASGGRRVDVSLTISPIRDPSGAVVGASKVARDITEKKRVAEALEAQRRWLHVTLASIGDGVVACDPRGLVSFINPVGESLTGWSSSEAIGRPLADVFSIISEETGQPVENPCRKVLDTGLIVGLANHTLLVRRDGTKTPIADSAAPIVDEVGTIAGVVLVFRDSSAERRAEMERSAAAAEREKLLESERAARAEAEKASRSKDDFVAMVSHELRTPLHAILGWTQILATRSSDPKTLKRGLGVIERNTRIQAQLVSDLLDVSRIMSSKLRLDLREADFAAVVDDAIQAVQSVADAKGIAVHRDLDDRLGPIRGDAGRLQQCVWNLLSNAIKFTPRGGRVTVALRRAGAQAELSVADDGIGIRPEFLPHVFDRFRQGQASITRQFGGLGLGLAIVKQLVELHGGRVRAESPGEGKGATFTLTLPLEGEMSRSEVRRRDSARAGERSLEDITVLVVEDDPDARELVERLLQEHDAQVLTAASALEGLQILADARPDVLVCDIGLPEVDGYELIRRIRKSERPGEGIPAIALTAYAAAEDRAQALRAGYQAHIAKPVEAPVLVATVARLVDLGAVRRPAELHATSK
jgi:PAS domain S-box-containing protein